MSTRSDQLRNQILDLVAEYYDAAFADRRFVPGESLVPVSGRCFDAREMQALIDSALDFWLTTGRLARRFLRVFSD
jgi:CDP-6-deoxy-D-xylo-4-hexulose-3-dehydrase